MSTFGSADRTVRRFADGHHTGDSAAYEATSILPLTCSALSNPSRAKPAIQRNWQTCATAMIMDTGIKLNEESVGQLGALSPLCLTSDTPVREALHVLRTQHCGALLVCRDEKLVGILTERDVVRILVEGHDLDAPLAKEMVSQPLTIRQSDSVATAIRKMAENGYRRLPVVDESHRPVSLVDAEAIMHFLVQHFPKAVYNLPPVANPATREREGS